MFGFGEKRFIGVDVGTSNVKIVELKISGNKPVLTNYAWIPIVGGLSDGREAKASYFEVALPEYIKKMLKEAHISSRDAIFSIPAFGGLITLIEFPDMEKKELDQAVRFEARKYIPMSLDDVILSWEVVRKNSPKRLIDKKNVLEEKELKEGERKSEGKLEILLVAAPKNKVSKYEQLAKDSGLRLRSIEIESFSLVRALIGNDQGNFVIVDIGSRICNIILVEKGVIKVNRNMDAGGRDITKVISRSVNVDSDRAEKLKVSENNFLSGESNMKFPVVDLIVGEVSRVIKAYYKDDREGLLDGVILSGGTAKFSGLEEYFSKNLGIKTILGNPLGRVEYDQKLRPKLSELGSYFSVAVGLALSGFDEELNK
jgi:type IV pilus assembly protein PilM